MEWYPHIHSIHILGIRGKRKPTRKWRIEFRSADPNPVPEQIQVPSVHIFQSKLEWNSRHLRHLDWLVPGPVLEPWNERGSQ